MAEGFLILFFLFAFNSLGTIWYSLLRHMYEFAAEIINNHRNVHRLFSLHTPVLLYVVLDHENSPENDLLV